MAHKAMSAGTQELINSLMLEFRHLMVGIQEEHDELRKNKWRSSPRRALQLTKGVKTNSTYTSATTSSTDSSSSPVYSATINGRQTTTTTTATTSSSSPFDNPSNTNTSGTVSSALTHFTQSIRPPPYKSLVTTLVPQVPARTRRKSSTISASRHTTTATTTTSPATMSAINTISRGALIVLEGLDRVGKSTLATKLVEHLERTKRQVTYCRFPDRTTPIGQLINDFLKNTKKVDDHAMHLLFSANRWEMSKRIRHTLNQGTTVIVDRYSYSGIAYSSAKRDLSMEWCTETERGLPKPDLVIYLELPKEAQYQRPGFGDERFETKEMQELVRQTYEHLMEITLEDWIRVDVDHKSPDQVLAEVIIPVKRCLENCANKELGSLNFRG